MISNAAVACNKKRSITSEYLHNDKKLLFSFLIWRVDTIKLLDVIFEIGAGNPKLPFSSYLILGLRSLDWSPNHWVKHCRTKSPTSGAPGPLSSCAFLPSPSGSPGTAVRTFASIPTLLSYSTSSFPAWPLSRRQSL